MSAVFIALADAVLHQCIRPLVGALLPATMDISARATSLAERSRWTIRVTSVRMRREDRSSISCRPLADLGGQSVDYIIDNSSISSSSFVRAVRPFLRPGLRAQTRRAQGPSRLAVTLALPLAPAFPGHALTGLSTARHSSRSGRSRIRPHALEGALLVENRPGDAGELVGERDREHVVVQSFLRRLDP
jgi:hypothetical protein